MGSDVIPFSFLMPVPERSSSTRDLTPPHTGFEYLCIPFPKDGTALRMLCGAPFASMFQSQPTLIHVLLRRLNLCAVLPASPADDASSSSSTFENDVETERHIAILFHNMFGALRSAAAAVDEQEHLDLSVLSLASSLFLFSPDLVSLCAEYRTLINIVQTTQKGAQVKRLHAWLLANGSKMEWYLKTYFLLPA